MRGMVIRRKQLEIDKGIIGVISDTHGLVRPEAIAALKGVELIIHGGDIGKAEVLQSLSSIAPVCAIRGNNDRDGWAKKLPDVLTLQINGVRVQVIHDVNELESDPNGAELHAVISGHSHKPSVVERDGVLFINPGSAGPRRFKLPVTVVRLDIHRGSLSSAILELL
ncbi:MAG: metallophosphoesterase family protein [Candidatus Binatia bacterium]